VSRPDAEITPASGVAAGGAPTASSVSVTVDHRGCPRANITEPWRSTPRTRETVRNQSRLAPGLRRRKVSCTRRDALRADFGGSDCTGRDPSICGTNLCIDRGDRGWVPLAHRAFHRVATCRRMTAQITFKRTWPDEPGLWRGNVRLFFADGRWQKSPWFWCHGRPCKWHEYKHSASGDGRRAHHKLQSECGSGTGISQSWGWLPGHGRTRYPCRC